MFQIVKKRGYCGKETVSISLWIVMKISFLFRTLFITQSVDVNIFFFFIFASKCGLGFNHESCWPSIKSNISFWLLAESIELVCRHEHEKLIWLTDIRIRWKSLNCNLVYDWNMWEEQKKYQLLISIYENNTAKKNMASCWHEFATVKSSWSLVQNTQNYHNHGFCWAFKGKFIFQMCNFGWNSLLNQSIFSELKKLNRKTFYFFFS